MGAGIPVELRINAIRPKEPHLPLWEGTTCEEAVLSRSGAFSAESI